MKRVKQPVTFFFLASMTLVLAVALVACFEPPFQDNPHGAAYVKQITPTAQPTVSLPAKPTVVPHLAQAGFGSTLQNLVAQYGQPTTYSVPPLYAFQDGPEKWPQGSLVIVTMKSGRAVEFSYVPGNHPMTFQEAQDFAVKLLPDDAQGPTTIQQEDDQQGKCLAKVYQSNLLKTIFPADDFMSMDGKDNKPGTVTINFYPELDRSYNYNGNIGQNGDGNNVLLNHNQVSSVLINLGERPSC
jgi:hypothetical protein